MIDFVPHRAVWTHENSARFRSELFLLTGGDENYFRAGMRDSLVRFARTNGGDLSGPVLELGSGHREADFSQAVLPVPSGETFSSALVVDTVEHLPDDDLRLLIAQLHGALRPGGSLVVATLNEEKLQIGETVCPDCGCMFHRVQHVRSWSAGGLTAYMSESGFETIATTPWYLDERWWKSRLITMAARAMRKRLPHLIYVGRKRVAR